MSAYRQENRRCGRALLGVLPLAVAFTSGILGCEDRQTAERMAASQAAEQSSVILDQVHRYGTAPAPPTQREAAYQQAIRALSTEAGKGLDIQQAALNSLMARSHAGLTDLRTYEILDIERRAASYAEQLRQVAEAIARVRQNADLLGDYDPTAERQMIDQQRRAANAELATLRQRERRLQTALNALTEEAMKHRSSYENYRLQADEMRSRIRDTYGAASRHALVEQASDLQRKADEQQKQYARRAAELDVQRPELERVQQLIEHGEAYLEILRQADLAVESRLSRRQEAAADQTELAEQFIGRGGELYSALMEMVETELSAAYEEAVGQAEQAIRAARTARSKAPAGAREAADTALARYQQALGKLRWQHARSLDDTAQALEPLAALRALPQHAALTANIERLLSSRDEMLDKATQSYSEAIETLGAVRGDRKLQRSIAGLSEQLRLIRAITSGGDFPADADGVDRDMVGDDEWGIDPGMADEPLEALFVLLDAFETGDLDLAAEMFFADDAEVEYVIDAWMDAARRVDRLNRACLDIFGMTLSECWDEYAADHPELSEADRALRAGDMALTGGLHLTLGELVGESPDPDDFEVVVQGSIATITHLPSGTEIRMIELNRAWFIHQDPAPEALAQMRRRIEQDAARTLRYPLIASQLESGEIGTIEELIEALRSL